MTGKKGDNEKLQRMMNAQKNNQAPEPPKNLYASFVKPATTTATTTTASYIPTSSASIVTSTTTTQAITTSITSTYVNSISYIPPTQNIIQIHTEESSEEIDIEEGSDSDMESVIEATPQETNKRLRSPNNDLELAQSEKKFFKNKAEAKEYLISHRDRYGIKTLESEINIVRMKAVYPAEASYSQHELKLKEAIELCPDLIKDNPKGKEQRKEKNRPSKQENKAEQKPDKKSSHLNESKKNASPKLKIDVNPPLALSNRFGALQTPTTPTEAATSQTSESSKMKSMFSPPEIIEKNKESTNKDKESTDKKKEKPKEAEGKKNQPSDPRLKIQGTNKPPPIVLEKPNNFGALHQLLLEKIQPGNYEAKARGPCINLYAKNDVIFFKITQLLLENGYNYHTYSIKQEKPLRYSIWPVPEDIEDSEISSELKDQGFEISNIYRIGETINIDLTRKEKNLEIEKLTTLFYFRVTVSMRKNRQITVCTRCCAYHHTQKHCKRKANCLRCGEAHHISECNNTEMNCFHCQENHTATSANCKIYQQEEIRIQRSRNKNTATGPPPPPPVNAWEERKKKTEKKQDQENEVKSFLKDMRQEQEDSDNSSGGIIKMLLDLFKSEVLPVLIQEAKNWLFQHGINWLKSNLKDLIPQILSSFL